MPPDDPVLDALSAELLAAMSLAAGAPSYVLLRVTESAQFSLGARRGVASPPRASHARVLVADVRHGPPELDSSRGREPWDGSASDGVPLGDDPTALRRAIRRVLGPAITASEDHLGEVRAEHAVRPPPSDPSPDRSAEAPVRAAHVLSRPEPDRAAWQARLERLSARFADPALHAGSATLGVDWETRWIVDSDGTRVRHDRAAARVVLSATAAAADGPVDLQVTRSAHRPEDLPDEAALADLADGLARDVVALAAAPDGEPAGGPVLLAGPAAAVWLHEVVGHRVEGHRQKDDLEGQTFRGRVGTAVLPRGWSIWDDPGVARLAGQDLGGHYRFDDEGRPAERVDLVRDGTFLGFLTSRSPIAGFARSNGHGRACAWSRATARMANTVLEVADPAPAASLRDRLVEEARRRGLPWGLLVDRTTGGFTLTGRFFPNAFSLSVARAWRVRVDGGPDELVRGLDVVGTPLVALGSLLAAGDDPTVFDGLCGAESGSVPVAAVSPSLLFGELEVQRQLRLPSRPPVLPPPPPADDPLAAEVERALGLRLPEAEPPGFVAFTHRDLDELRIRVLPGGRESRVSERSRELACEVRVGDTVTDSANAGSDAGIAVDPDAPPEDAPAELARAAWLLADACWKAAPAGLAAKVAARRDRPADGQRPPALDRTPGEVAAEPPPPPLDVERLDAVADALAAALAAHPDLREASACVEAHAGVLRRVDSLGTRVRRAEAGVGVALAARVRAADGRCSEDVVARFARAAADLDPAALAAEVDALAGRLRAWAGARRVTEEWTGPVVLTGAAALRVFRDVLLVGLAGTPAADADADAPGPYRLGRRALPAGWAAIDDPDTWRDAAGSRLVDLEGVRAARLGLVEGGIVRALLASRTPGPGASRSNGRAAGPLDELPRAAPTQVTVTPAAVLGLAELRREALGLADAADADAALEIGHLDPDGRPLDAVLRGADGRVEPVRGLRFVGLGRATLLDVVAAGPSARATLPWHRPDDVGDAFPLHGLPFTLSAPAVLLRRLTLEPDGEPSTPSPRL